jgi:hypothetical protein
MSAGFLYSQMPAPTLLPAFWHFENFVLFHPMNEVPGYDGR